MVMLEEETFTRGLNLDRFTQTTPYRSLGVKIQGIGCFTGLPGLQRF